MLNSIERAYLYNAARRDLTKTGAARQERKNWRLIAHVEQIKPERLERLLVAESNRQYASKLARPAR